MMSNQGEILAFDKYEAKLQLIHRSVERLGLTIITLRAEDASTVDLEPADRVLLDAPCSGLGTLAKKPDMKWKRDVTDLIPLTRGQNAMLDNAARLVRPGGVLVYSTCTIEPEENQEIVAAFLAGHPEFTLDPAGGLVHADLVSPEGFVQTYPHRHGMDGSFAARLVRTQ
jgi:16S rRNA (cytosine967-C5)-methyltransferase